MGDKKTKANLNIRPDIDHKGIIEKLEKLANYEGRSLNNYVLRVLAKHIKKEFMPRLKEI